MHLTIIVRQRIEKDNDYKEDQEFSKCRKHFKERFSKIIAYYLIMIKNRFSGKVPC